MLPERLPAAQCSIYTQLCKAGGQLVPFCSPQSHDVVLSINQAMRPGLRLMVQERGCQAPDRASSRFSVKLTVSRGDDNITTRASIESSPRTAAQNRTYHIVDLGVLIAAI